MHLCEHRSSKLAGVLRTRGRGLSFGQVDLESLWNKNMSGEAWPACPRAMKSTMNSPMSLGLVEIQY